MVDAATSAATKASHTVASTATKATHSVASSVSKVTGSMSSSTFTSLGSGTAPGGKSSSEDENGVLTCLLEHRLAAVVEDLDYFRKNKFMVVETDYIIHVTASSTPSPGVNKKDATDIEFDFLLSKTFSEFRFLAEALYKEAETYMKSKDSSCANLPKSIAKLLKYCDAANRLMESQSTEYLNKVNYSYVQTLAKQRSEVINAFLDETMANFPDRSSVEKHPLARRVMTLVEQFFLTDHCEAVEGEDATSSERDAFGKIIHQPIVKKYQDRKGTVVVPQTKKIRESKERRLTMKQELINASVLRVDDGGGAAAAAEKPKKPAASASTSVWKFLDEQPIVAMAVFAGAAQVLRLIGTKPITLDSDILLMAGFACFCLGMHLPRLLGVVLTSSSSWSKQQMRPQLARTDATGAKLMRASMIATGSPGMMPDLVEEVIETLESPLPRFPEGAALGSVMHAWSVPPSTNFKVRGDKYLTDKKKIGSGPFIFENRGIDLFLTDQCPENVGRLSCLLNNKLRSVPTFIINFRLPWGVLLFYCEIPERFLPFIKGCYADGNKAELEAKMKEMSNTDRCCARFLLGNDEHKNNSLKIFPTVVEGPWVVKASVGGKPAIIGTKLPVKYTYQPEDIAADGAKQELYLEADLDIASSSAARGILSLVRSYTQDLTIDLGFGIQGNSNDELPERMLTGTRIHGLDPLHAPPLPTMKDMIFGTDETDSDSDSEEE